MVLLVFAKGGIDIHKPTTNSRSLGYPGSVRQSEETSSLFMTQPKHIILPSQTASESDMKHLTDWSLGANQADGREMTVMMCTNEQQFHTTYRIRNVCQHTAELKRHKINHSYGNQLNAATPSSPLMLNVAIANDPVHVTQSGYKTSLTKAQSS